MYEAKVGQWFKVCVWSDSVGKWRKFALFFFEYDALQYERNLSQIGYKTKIVRVERGFKQDEM